MNDYQPPLADIAFALEHVVGYPDIAALPGFEHADLDTVVELLEQCGEFMAEAVAPTNRQGDLQGSQLQADGSVVTPQGFKELYQQYVEAGWGSVPLPEEFGGGGFPRTIGLVIQELMTSANMAFSLCPLLTQGAIEALLHYGSDELKVRYLPPMVIVRSKEQSASLAADRYGYMRSEQLRTPTADNALVKDLGMSVLPALNKNNVPVNGDMLVTPPPIDLRAPTKAKPGAAVPLTDHLRGAPAV